MTAARPIALTSATLGVSTRDSRPRSSSTSMVDVSTVLGENHGRMFTHLRPMRFFDPSVVPDVRLLVVEGGPVSNNKGLSLPGIGVSVPALSEKDVEDLRWTLHDIVGEGEMVIARFTASCPRTSTKSSGSATFDA